ncbi:endonuclease [Brucella melitensis]|nr:endonuclease [Brucella melitensis]ARY05446.1 endonuclease [Brucella melitensis]ARY11777.1 endonuclease [Brucella melitensis]ARY14961.1 endonuclease [Brucella melitensis]ARY18117.1 endonuclease [Brucella melitensis]
MDHLPVRRIAEDFRIHDCLPVSRPEINATSRIAARRARGVADIVRFFPNYLPCRGRWEHPYSLDGAPCYHIRIGSIQ